MGTNNTENLGNQTVNEASLKDINTLFEHVSPSSLRKSINQLFFSYLIETDTRLLPTNFDTMIEDIFL